MNVEEFDENRELCADGNCLGVLVAGKCNVCGLSPNGPVPSTPASREMVAEGGHIEAAEADATGAFDDDDRRLCPDGACTGLLGSDSKCKVCGRTA
jgi:hypothetical protein